MRLLLFCISVLLVSLSASSQQSLPTIRANSRSVDIRVGNAYFSKGGWSLDPSKNPDTFSIGSKWDYHFKNVTFITDIDSISFRAQPGQQYDFIILLNGTMPCYTRIVTQPIPVFLHTKPLILLFAALVLMVLVLYFTRNSIKAEYYLKAGWFGVILFWLMTIIGGTLQTNYHHQRDTISALGAAGTNAELFTSTSLLLISLCCILFSAGFYRVSKKNKIAVLPAVLSLAMPITMLWASVFTLGNEFHSATGPLPLLVIAGSLLSFILWRKNNFLRTTRYISLFTFFVMSLVLLRFLHPFNSQYPGLIQRFYYLGWSIWTIAILIRFSTLSRDTTVSGK